MLLYITFRISDSHKSGNYGVGHRGEDDAGDVDDDDDDDDDEGQEIHHF